MRKTQEVHITRCASSAIGAGVAMSAIGVLVVVLIQRQPFSFVALHMVLALMLFIVGANIGASRYRAKHTDFNEASAKAIGRIVGWSVLALSSAFTAALIAGPALD